MSTNLSPGATRPPVDIDQEVRFAVVMYGGASLAIYINGVAQELLRLVRATAPELSGNSNGRQAHLADEELKGPERVYRRLGRLLRRQRTPSAGLNDVNGDAGKSGPIRTRFVVDILTGTSAGGINAVFLAKALANNQDMVKLKDVWVTEGDIEVLINDKDPYPDLKPTLADGEDEPWSLLNSRRMYYALLNALRGMDADKSACAAGKSPLVDELDLYVTSTDMFGRPIQMRLADDVVSEYRHRNVFQFRYRSKRASDMDYSDFGREYNAFLAFVARATSAHQAAFSPIRLSDVDLITRANLKDRPLDEYSVEHEGLRIFYRDYLLQRTTNANGEAAEVDVEALAEAFQKVWFVDGGTLDNKPFSFVSEELPLRHANTFVDRKLLYIEPSPEQSEMKKAPDSRPQIVGNAIAGLSSLPRYETIVEDLTRLLERNRLVERVDHIMRGMEKDLVYGIQQKQRRTRQQFLEMLKDRDKLLDWLKSKGTAWGSYQRLRVAEVTDDLTLLVARAAGFSEESDEFLSIRYLVRQWRDSNYDSHMEEGKFSQVQFLVEFDLLWAMRRIRFIIQKLNDIACLDDDARRIAGVAHGKRESEVWPREEEVGEFRTVVQDFREKLNKIYVTLRGERRKLWVRDETNPFRKFIKTLEISSSDLLELLHEPTDTARREKAKSLLNTPLRNPPADRSDLQTRAHAINDLNKNVKEELKTVIVKARDDLSRALRPLEGEATEKQPRWESFLRDTLWYYYVYFEDFDQISYPILYSTGVGEEADVIDVFRVSPLDATALIDESKQVDSQGQKVRKAKLAGTTLGNFGAFFERKFRINDIMWGRLDGAERVIAALLPTNAELRRELTEEAHREIIKEEATNRIDLASAHANKVFGSLPENEQRATANLSLKKLVEESLDLMVSNNDCAKQLDNIDRDVSRLPEDSRWRRFLESFVLEFRPFVREYIVPCANGMNAIDAFKNWFNAQYQDGRTFTQHATVNSVVRMNRVLGDMALAYVPPNGSGFRTLAMWLGKRLRLFVEAAIEPDGSARRKQRRRLRIAYVLSILIGVFVLLPVVLLLLSATSLWTGIGLAIILVVTFILAVIPLVLTFVYDGLGSKLSNKLEAFLLTARRN
jgi:patatin-related protein